MFNMNVPQEYWGEAVHSLHISQTGLHPEYSISKHLFRNFRNLFPLHLSIVLNPVSLDAQHMFIRHSKNWIRGPSAVSLLAMPIFKRGIDIMIRMLKKCMLLGMFSSTKIYLFSLNPSVLFRGRKFRTSLKITL